MTTLSAFATFLLGATACSAQVLADGPIYPRPMRLTVVATDSHNKPITSLTAGDIQIADAGKPQLITTFLYSEGIRKQMPQAYFVEMGRQGGLKGGVIRSQKLNPERRKEIAQKAIAARWAKAHAKPI